jgi:hypothetical protein
MNIRQFEPEDTVAVIALWEDCELTRPWNDDANKFYESMGYEPFQVTDFGKRLISDQED